MTLAVDMRAISKRYGNVQALDNVDLHVEAGTLHAVVGENGAGKTTLMRILYGAEHPDGGEITVNGMLGPFDGPAEALQHGVGMVSQHYSIIPELSCLDNLILGAEGAWLPNRKQAHERAERLAKMVGFLLDWNAPASDLSPSAAQRLEIVKLLWREAGIMILDEPTSMLSPGDSDALFATLHGLVEKGSTIILVTHRLPEVLAHSSRVSVLRGGRVVAERYTSDTNAAELAELIVGHSFSEPQKGRTNAGEVMLNVRSLSSIDKVGRSRLNAVDFELKTGEVVGVAGVDGNGQRELIECLIGVRPITSGNVQWLGREITDSPTRTRLEQGLRLIPEDRHDESLVETWSLDENASLGLQRRAPFAKGQLIDLHARSKSAAAMASFLGTKYSAVTQPISDLSGGNQQRFVAGRALYLSPKLILAVQPSRGLDIDATARFYGLIRAKCAEGACALVVSFDLDELLQHCDRILVMRDGQLLSPPNADRAAIGALMLGGRT